MSDILTINKREFREMNIQMAQSNFYHYCSLMFPDYYSYHGYIKRSKSGKKKLIYPQVDHEYPLLTAKEKKLLIEHKNFDNIREAIGGGKLKLSKPIKNLILKEPEFLKIRKKYLYDFCELLQAFFEGRLVDPSGKPYKKLMINMPPRAKKTLTLKLFVAWMLGKDTSKKIFSISYNRDLSVMFGKDIRNIIETESVNPDIITSRDIFPDTRIKKGDAAQEKWSLEGRHFTLLSTSPGSTQTGIGFDIALIDDIIKNALEYYNDRVTDGHWEYVVNTLLSRKNTSAACIVIVMHRWGENDLCGKFLAKEGSEWAVIKFPAYDIERDVMLDPSVMTKEDYLNRKELTNPDIFLANYMQIIQAAEGYLYSTFQEYEERPKEFEYIGFYLDTADQGEDFLSGWFFGMLKGRAYVLNAIYTQLSAEVTEIEVCDKTIEHKCEVGFIESNSGGHAYARNVRRILEDERKYYLCKVHEFTQSENKIARILANRTNVTNYIIMPRGWAQRWPELYKTITTAKVKAKWKHDDAFDSLTGVYEKFVDYSAPKFL